MLGSTQAGFSSDFFVLLLLWLLPLGGAIASFVAGARTHGCSVGWYALGSILIVLTLLALVLFMTVGQCFTPGATCFE